MWRRLLEAQLEATAHVGARLLELGCREPRSSRSRASSARMAPSAVDLVVRVHAGVDLEHARVRVVRLEGVDVVGQPRILAHRQEQPRRGPVTQDRVEQLECPLVGMVAGQGRQAEAQVRLCGAPSLDDQPRARRRRRRQPRAGRPPGPEAARASARRRRHEQVARDGDDQVRRAGTAPPRSRGCRAVHRAPTVSSSPAISQPSGVSP